MIERAAPHLVKELGVSEIVLAGGELPEPGWRESFQERVAPTPVRFFTEPAFGYFSERSQSPSTLAGRLRAALARLLDGVRPAQCLVWAHNLGIARNLLLARALIEACAARHIRVVAHHHDWWFDNRWSRWPELRRGGFRTLRGVARTVFSPEPNLIHLAINQADARVLQRHFPVRAAWLPNLAEPFPALPPARVQRARTWVRTRFIPERAPFWLLPARLLRRKNIAEALLLTRWLRPEAWLVTSAGVSSADETAYAKALETAALRHEWPLRLGVLHAAGKERPSVAELLAASEAVLLTSLQEGFGLPYLEAAAAGRPLIARSLPNIAPDLDQLGFRFPQLYEEVLIDPGLFDWAAEQRRQEKLFRAWRARLPRPCQNWPGRPVVLAAGDTPQPVPFSRLTLTAQLEVLAQPLSRSWELCAPLNPWLPLWRRRVQAGTLEPTSWPPLAEAWLSGPAYARRFAALAQRPAKAAPNPDASGAAQATFIRQKLAAANLFPLLWSRQT